MKQFLTLLLLTCALSVGACGGDPSLPEATGKASIRAINGMRTSSDVAFLIEELNIGAIGYKAASTTAEYDDLSYRFNFEALFIGDATNTRFASQQLDVVADMDYTFVLMGSITSPTVTLFETPERTFSGTETVFQTRFLNTAEIFGAVDLYFGAPGVAPVMGESVATLAAGQMSDPVDFAAGDYVLTLTAVGDPTTIHHTSSTVSIAAENDFIVSMFDADADDSSPLIVLASGTSGAVLSLADPSFLPTMEFLNASIDLGAVDIYDDEALTSQIVTDLNYKQLSPAQAVAAGETTYRLTPAGDTATVTIEQLLSVVSGIRYRLVAIGSDGSYALVPIALDRRSIDTAAKLLLFQASINVPLLDYYVVEAGVTITDEAPFRTQVLSGTQVAASGIAAGSYDLYVAESGSTDIIGGPLRFDAELGSVYELMVYDTVDPTVLELEFLTTP